VSDGYGGATLTAPTGTSPSQGTQHEVRVVDPVDTPLNGGQRLRTGLYRGHAHDVMSERSFLAHNECLR
jgi:hypothetical protein